MELYLIRHTTPSVDKGTCYGQSDVALADTFLEEFEKVRTHLPAAFDKVYSSPLLRCRQMATLLARGKDISDDKRLMELNFGTWEKKRWDEIPPAELDPWMKDFVHVTVPGGENFQALFDRTRAFYEELSKTKHATVGIVCHAGVIRAFLAHVLEIPLHNAFKIPVSYASVTKLRLDPSSCYCSLEYLNRE